MNRIIYRQGNYGSICFPYKESCEFATKKCLRECSEQYNDMTWFTKVYETFLEKSNVELYSMIRSRMKNLGFKLLSWFDCGDCPTKLTKKIEEIILQLHRDGFIQVGFTRNKSLWNRLQNINNIRFILTVERGTKVTKEGYYAIPDYKNQRVCIVHLHTFEKPTQESIDEIIAKGAAFLRYCGGSGSYIEYKIVKEPELIARCVSWNSNTGIIDEIYESNCQYCYEAKRGCFAEDKRK